MTLHASDLPADVRRKLGLDEAATTHKRPSRAGVGDSAPCPGTCGCGERFPDALAWERHADAEGHHRWNIDLEAGQ